MTVKFEGTVLRKILLVNMSREIKLGYVESDIVKRWVTSKVKSHQEPVNIKNRGMSRGLLTCPNPTGHDKSWVTSRVSIKKKMYGGR